MSKQKVLQKYVFKIHSARLRKNRWNLNLPLQEARLSGELISLADSQVLRWIDELNGLEDADGEARRIRSEIKRVRSEPSSLHNKRKIRALYCELDAVQFKPDYMCLVIDKEKDYQRAVKGFTINGVKYVRLLATVGGVKTSTVVFVSERLAGELRRRIDNGRDKSKAIVPAKLEAYRALSCSASVPVSNPRGILVVSDCITKIKEDVIYLYNPEDDGEPVLEYRDGYEMELDESDGYGLISPEFAAKWAEDLELDYVPSGFNTRNSFEKGMIFVFPFEEFAEKIADGKYIVKDVWGNDIDVRTVDLILTESMLKLWSSYQNIEEYVRNCEENHYSFAVTKVSPKRLDSERSLNYQFIQSYDLDDAAIEELVSPTVSEIHDILGGDINKTILYSLGKGLTDRSVVGVPDGAIKALLVEPEMEADPYVRSVVRGAISKRIDQAKIGVLGVHGNYSIVSGDPFILCQHIFGLEETGLLKKGEIFNRYWLDSGADEVAVFRAPMTCHNNIARMKVHKSDDACYWYRYMSQVSLFDAWSSTPQRLNGMDKRLCPARE